MWGASEGRVARRVVATVLALAAAIVALSLGPVSVEASEATANPAPVEQDVPGPDRQRSLRLSLPGKLKVGKRATVRVAGSAEAGDQLSVFVDPKGEDCARFAADQPRRAIVLISAITTEGAFGVEATYRPRRGGDRTFCAYLEKPEEYTGGVALQASQARRVTLRRLRRSTARRAVVTALKRHGFAERVVKSVKRDCRRRRRNLFACEFSARFPGYRLKGRGKVRLGVTLSYRFRVKAQGDRLTLTDRNEEPRSTS